MFEQHLDPSFDQMISTVYRQTSRYLLEALIERYHFLDHLRVNPCLSSMFWWTTDASAIIVCFNHIWWFDAGNLELKSVFLPCLWPFHIGTLETFHEFVLTCLFVLLKHCFSSTSLLLHSAFLRTRQLFWKYAPLLNIGWPVLYLTSAGHEMLTI